MKADKNRQDDKTRREKILESLIASFKMEGIDIPEQFAARTLKKLELTLGK